MKHVTDILYRVSGGATLLHETCNMKIEPTLGGVPC